MPGPVIIGQGRADLGGLIRHARLFQQAGAGHHQQVVVGQVLPRPLLPEGGEHAVDQPGVEGLKRLVAQPQPLQPLLGHVGHQHIKAGDQPPQKLLSGLLAQVHREAFLSPVIIRGIGTVRPIRPSSPAADGIAPPRRLDLQHLGAVVGEQAARIGIAVGQVEDL